MDSNAVLNKRLKMIIGAIVFLISFIVYTDSVAPTTSFWDCGEFIACSRILGVMHPPGAPLYLLIGRVLTMLPFVNDVGLRVNLFSVFVSAATVLLTFLIIVQLIQRWRGEFKSFEDRFIAFASGAFGALALAFSDSFWFNAVEAEVYAFSIFLTALVVWLALKWGEQSETAGNMLIIFFIFYVFGLATGVHLLNILVYPFVLLIAFFHHNQSVRRLLLLIFVQAALPILCYVLFFQFNPDTTYYTEILTHQAKASAFLKWFGLIWLIITMVYMYRKDRQVFAAWWVIPVVALVGYSTYLLIYIRATLAPPINENDPSTWAGMIDYLARKQYGTEDMMLTFIYRKTDFWNYQIQLMFTRYFGWQFIGQGTTLDYYDRIMEIISFRGLYGLPFLIGLWGAVHHFFKDWKRALAVGVLFFLTGYAIIIYLNQPDPQPRERDYSYVGSFFAFAIWIGIGLAGVLEWVAEAIQKKKTLQRATLVAVSLVLLVAVPVNMYAFNYHSHDRSGNYVASDYSYNILQTCEPNAIIFTNGDNDTFPLWYLQEVEKVRTDVRVVNLSLLNTNWYIKQLRDQEPRIPLDLSDSKIDQLQPVVWESKEMQLNVPDDVYQELAAAGHPVEKAVKFQLKPTFNSGGAQGLRVQDMMILRILQNVQWRRPVYFAVTVSNENKITLNPYMRMDGLAFKVVPYKVKDVDPDILVENLLSKYRYRGLNDPDVYLNINIIKLLQNYRSAFMELARYYIDNDQKEKAAELIDHMMELMPEDHIPYSDERGALFVSDLYQRSGRETDAVERATKVIPGRYMSRQDRSWLASYYLQVLNEYDRAEELYRELIMENPEDAQAYSGLVSLYRWSKQYDKGIALLEDWLSRHPDPNAEVQLTEMKRLAVQDTLQ